MDIDQRLRTVMEKLKGLMSFLDTDSREALEELYSIARLVVDKSKAIDKAVAILVQAGTVKSEGRSKAQSEEAVHVLELSNTSRPGLVKTRFVPHPVGYQPSEKVRALDDIKLELLLAKKLGQDAFAQKLSELTPKIEVGEGKSFSIVVRGLLASTQGKRQPEYVARMVLFRSGQKEREEILEKLSLATDLAPSVLKRQAKKTTLWKRLNKAA